MSIKRILFGNPIRTDRAEHERLNKKTALAVFSSDALSSTAYATEEILLVLAIAAVGFSQPQAFNYVVPISIAIAVLLAIVTISYRQTIHAYPSGGGAYIVAKDNLGTTPGLVAGAALLVDYVLTVSVSIAAGAAAITSAAQGTQLAWLTDYKVSLCVFFIFLIMFANLRGVRESGALFALPTYAFLASFLLMIGYGLFHYYSIGGAVPVPASEDIKLAEGYESQALSLFLLLGAFSNGCTALTGVEAISNGVQAFKKPEARNAAATLVWMAVLLSVMFLGTSALAYLYGVHPHTDETVISQFARLIFTGNLGWFYFVIQAATAAILILAANTAFADFPRLASLLARDRFLPRQFANRGDRLVFSNGIVILAIASSVLVLAFGGDTSRLIPLYAVGVFLSFTLSQSGMVRHWLRERDKKLGRVVDEKPLDSIHITSSDAGAMSDPILAASEEASRQYQAVEDAVSGSKNWRTGLFINLLGAIATGIVLAVFIATKFVHGAWLVVLIVPLLVFLFRGIHRHYVSVANQLSTAELEPLRPVKHEVIVPISGIHRGVVHALEYAKSISPGRVTAVYIEIEEGASRKLEEKWEEWNAGVSLVVLKSPYRSLTRPLLKYINRAALNGDELVTVILPEFVPAKWWHQILHNQSSLLLKGILLFQKNVVVTNIRYYLER
jgi:amino acid transporter